MNAIDVTIIGAGPAGIAAAIQLKRYRIDALLFDRDGTGGLLKNANKVENYPGFPDGITGPVLVDKFLQHLGSSGLRLHRETVVKLNYERNLFSVQTDRRTVFSRVVVIASGTNPIPLADPAPAPETDSCIFYEIHPLAAAENKTIAIIGAGDAAFDYALNAARRNRVIIFNRGRRIRCLPLLWDRASKTASISYLQDTHVTKISRRAAGLLLTCRDGKREYEMESSYLIAALGRTPSLDFLGDRLEHARAGLQASKQLYLIGDVAGGIYRQTAIAAGNGIKAAMEIAQHLKETSA
jgi:thioredoxin reductase (NADPH)